MGIMVVVMVILLRKRRIMTIFHWCAGKSRWETADTAMKTAFFRSGSMGQHYGALVLARGVSVRSARERTVTRQTGFWYNANNASKGTM
jgi:hypothetical protein